MQSDLTIVTGAARGMGEAIARAFAAEGHPLVLCDIMAQPLAELAADLSARTEVIQVHGDIASAQFLSRLAAAVGERKVAALVHAAGVSPSMDKGRRIFEINFSATKTLVEALLPKMAPHGALVLIASNSGQLIAGKTMDRMLAKVMRGGRSFLIDRMMRNPGAAYSLSKRAVQLLAQSLAPTLREGVRIVSLSPGIIDTEMGRLEQGATPAMDRMIGISPLKRLGRAEEIASTVVFLTSPAASFINGTDILVDGGQVAAIAAHGGPRRALR